MSQTKVLVPRGLPKIASNTVFLYLRFASVFLADVWSVRVALGALGIAGYGTYSAVVGVALLALVALTVMETTAHRFISCELGRTGKESVQAVFSTVLTLSLMLAGAVLLLGETVGMWFVRTRFSVPCEFASAVPLAFRTGEAIVLFKLLQLPFASLVYSTERMSFFAVVGLAEAALLLGAAYAAAGCGGRALPAFAVGTAAGAACLLALHVAFCRRCWPSVCLRLRLGTVRIAEMGWFFLWGCLSALGNVAKYKGVNILLNLYAGVTFNATWESSLRGAGILGVLSVGVQQAVVPSIYKQWATDGGSAAFGRRTGRIVLAVFALSAVPAFLACAFAPQLTRLWLGADMPPQIAAFVICACLNGLADAVSHPLTTAIQATGRVSLYNAMAFLFSIAGFAGAWAVLAAGFPPWTAFAAVAASNALACAYRWAHLRFLVGVKLASCF